MAIPVLPSQDKSSQGPSARAAVMGVRAKRVLSATAFGAFILLVSYYLDVYLTRLGISLSATLLDNFLVSLLAGLLAFAWATAAAEKHQSELSLEKLKHEAVLRERNRIAQDIHDTVSQGLAGLSTSLKPPRIFSPKGPAPRNIWNGRGDLRARH
jgi:signal transduction histidine kinase